MSLQQQARTITQVVAMALLMVMTAALAGAEGIEVHPKRIIIEEGRRHGAATLSNAGDAPVTFILEWRRYKMTENGGMHPIETAEDSEAIVSHLRFFPRRVTVPPKSNQTVRVMVRQIDELAQREHLIHLFFRALPKAEKIEAPQEIEPDVMEIKLTAVQSMAVPVIIRLGSPVAHIALTELKIESNDQDEPVRLTFLCLREGNRSVFGDIEATWYGQGASAPVPVGRLGSVAIYTSVSQRRVTLDLQPPENGFTGPGEIHLVYTDRQKARPIELAQARLPLE